MTEKITYEPEYKGLPILTNKEKNQGCLKKILDKNYKLLKDYTESHPRTMFMRFDLRMPANAAICDEGTAFPKFINSFTKNLDRKGLDPKYIWVKERSREKHGHYHLSCCLSARNSQNIHGHISKAEELWGKALGLPESVNHGLVNNCCVSRSGEKQENGIILNRKSEDFQSRFNDSFKWMSYLAKVSTKQPQKNSRMFGSSCGSKKVI